MCERDNVYTTGRAKLDGNTSFLYMIFIGNKLNGVIGCDKLLLHLLYDYVFFFVTIFFFL